MKTKQIAEQIANALMVKSPLVVSSDLAIIKDKVAIPFRTIQMTSNVNTLLIKAEIERFIENNDTDFYAKYGCNALEAKYNHFSKVLELRLLTVFEKDNLEKIAYFADLRKTGIKNI